MLFVVCVECENLPSVVTVSDVLSEIELAASDLVKESVSGKIRLEIDDDDLYPSRTGVGGSVRTEPVLI